MTTTVNSRPAILVVDDDEIFRAAMSQILDVLGYRVLELPSGVGVRDLVENEKPVLCLIDLVMDDREGVETLIELHSMENPLKLVAVSSNLQYLDFTRNFGVAATLGKPISRERLEATLKKLLP